jgi:hypothetical protein
MNWIKQRDTIIWNTKGGTKVPLSQMTSYHMEAALALCERNPGWRDEFIPLFKQEMELRKEIASSPLVKMLKE